MFKNILFPIDLHYADTAMQVSNNVRVLTSGFDADLHVMTVLPGFGMPIVAGYFPKNAMQLAKQEISRKLQEFVSEQFTENTAYSIAVGKNWEMIIETASRLDIDLIIMAHRKKARAGEIFLGSCAEKVSERAACSVLIIR
ncbi:MAG TPA: universal stress protein [Gammaproteobacteria bacterium]|nr:universal stress protein [Gammaproteobacteria bacterium]